MPIIHIADVVSFSPAYGVIVHREGLRLEPEVLRAWVKIAHEHLADDALIAAHCGAAGPLADIGHVSLEDYIGIRKERGLA